MDNNQLVIEDIKSKYLLYYTPYALTMGYSIEPEKSNVGLSTHILALYTLYKMGGKVSEIKDFILNKLAVNFKHPHEFSDHTIMVYKKFLKTLREYQYENKILESFILNSAPIVPYQGTIVKPSMENSEVSIYPREEIHTIHNLLENMNGNSMDSTLIELLDNNFQNIFKLAESLFIKDNSERISYDSIFSRINKLRQLESQYKESCIFFILSYINYKCLTEDDYAKVNEFLVLSLNTFTEETPMEKIITTLESFISTPEDDYCMTPNSTKKLEYEFDKEEKKIMGEPVDPSRYDNMLHLNYNLDKLTAYIHNQRRFLRNEYTNSLFIGQHKSINGYTYLEDDMLVCELNDKYLCVPVIDLGDDYKLKYILLDKDNVITVVNNIE